MRDAPRLFWREFSPEMNHLGLLTDETSYRWVRFHSALSRILATI